MLAWLLRSGLDSQKIRISSSAVPMRWRSGSQFSSLLCSEDNPSILSWKKSYFLSSSRIQNPFNHIFIRVNISFCFTTPSTNMDFETIPLVTTIKQFFANSLLGFELGLFESKVGRPKRVLFCLFDGYIVAAIAKQKSKLCGQLQCATDTCELRHPCEHEFCLEDAKVEAKYKNRRGEINQLLCVECAKYESCWIIAKSSYTRFLAIRKH